VGDLVSASTATSAECSASAPTRQRPHQQCTQLAGRRRGHADLSWRLTLLIAALLPLQLLVRHTRPRIEASTRATREASGR